MDKLISSEKLIHDLSGIRDTLPDIFLKNVMSAAISCVEKQHTVEVAALREQEERRWIPVTERLPEPGERVLATDGGFVGEFYVNSRGQWRRYNVNDHALLMALDILWWMPLPEPPKEE